MSGERSKLKKWLEHKVKFKVSGDSLDKALREYNNYEMPISLRVKLINSSEEEFKKFKLFFINELYKQSSKGILWDI